MALETKLSQKLTQSLQLTPQLQQAIKLLQLGRTEFLQELQRELDQNPILEVESENADGSAPVPTPEEQSESPQGSTDGDSDSGQADSPQDAEPAWEQLLELYSEDRGYTAPRDPSEEERFSVEARPSRDETLDEHLLKQLQLTDAAEDEKQAVSFLIGSLTGDGYLTQSVEELSELSLIPVEMLKRALEILHSFDPPGIGARTLQECLLLQLDERGMLELLEGKIVQKHLSLLEKRRLEEIARLEHIELERVIRAIGTLRTLQPYPGRLFSQDPTSYVVPDLYIVKMGDEYKVTLNDEGIPKLRVSSQYLELLKSAESQRGEQKQFLQEKLKSASWLLKSIHQRQMTICKVAECIARVQRDFLDFGRAYLKPLTLKDIAKEAQLHESTISRVTSNKFAHTPQGVFELKFFFTNSIPSGEGDVSSMAVKERIRALIAGEPAGKPISDQAIADTLKRENLGIARRTVAKYREELGIPTSSQRKNPY